MSLHRQVAFDKARVFYQTALQRFKFRLVHVFDDVGIDANQHRPSGWAVVGVALLKIARQMPGMQGVDCYITLVASLTPYTLVFFPFCI